VIYGDLSPLANAEIQQKLETFLAGRLSGVFGYFLALNGMNITHLRKAFVPINNVHPLIATAKIDFDIEIVSELIYKSKEDRYRV
jgi:hypothetical protein